MDYGDRRLKILFIHTRYLQSAGGEDAVFEAETALLRSKGHEVSTLIFDNATMGKGVTGKLAAGINSVYNRASAQRLRSMVAGNPPDIIHIHNFFFTASPSILIQAHKMNIPVVVTLHNFRLVCVNSLLLRNNTVCELCLPHRFPWYGVKYRCYHNSATQSAMVGSMAAIHKWLGTWKKKVDRYLTPAGFIRNKLLASSFNVDAGKIAVKHNFTADTGYTDASERIGSYLFAGRLSPEKGLHVLLDAWKEMPGRTLLIAGDGPEMQALVYRYGSLANVEFLGRKRHEEVLLLMKRCRALIFPSTCYEGAPLTIIEAFSTGTPVIASDHGAMQEMVAHYQNGILFPPGDPAGLVNAVSAFEERIGDGDLSMYEKARKTYLQQFHPDRCYESVMKIYHELLAAKKQTAGDA